MAYPMHASATAGAAATAGATENDAPKKATNEAKKVLREIRLLRDFRHPNVISLLALIPPASMETFDDIFMVTDFMDGDLRKRIKSKQEMPVETVRSYMAQLLSALAHVHAIHGARRDLDPPPPRLLLARCPPRDCNQRLFPPAQASTAT